LENTSRGCGEVKETIDMKRKFLFIASLCIIIAFSSIRCTWSQENNSSLEQRIGELKKKLNGLFSLLEEQKKEYIKQHPIQIEPSIEPNVMWELTKEAEGKESYQYLAKFVETFPSDPRVKDARWYMSLSLILIGIPTSKRRG